MSREPEAPPPVLYRWLKRALDRAGADRWVVIAGLLVLCVSLDTGLSADDYVHELMANSSTAITGFVREPLDMYRFAGGEHTRSLMTEGILGWWDDPDAKLAFFRPLSALTHVIDYRLWPKAGWAMHAHSLLWVALLYAGLLAFYRQLLGPTFVCALALFVYAFDDARGWLESWVAARNAVISTAISVWALVFHHRARALGDRRGIFIAPILLLLGLLAGEGAAATLAYLFAYALFLDRGSVRERALSLAPYALVVIPWRAIWLTLGYGVAHSGLYFDPFGDTREYVHAFMERAPILLFSQIGGAWSDIWNILFVMPTLQRVLLISAFLALLVIGYLLVPLWQREPSVRFGLLGGLISVIPASAAFIADRLLTWIAIGGAIVIAQLIVTYGETPAALRTSRLRTWLLPPVMFGLLVGKTIIDPLALPSRTRGNLIIRDSLDRAQGSVPSDASIANRRVVYVNPPGVPLAAYIPIERAAQGIPRPKSQLYLATGEADLRLERIDATTLRVRQRGGFLQSPGSHLLRNPRKPFQLGYAVQLEGVRVEVSALTPDHRPLEITTRFDVPLEDPSLCWLQWHEHRYRPYQPPAIGQHGFVRALDLARVLLADMPWLPFDGRLFQPPDPYWDE